MTPLPAPVCRPRWLQRQKLDTGGFSWCRTHRQYSFMVVEVETHSARSQLTSFGFVSVRETGAVVDVIVINGQQFGGGGGLANGP